MSFETGLLKPGGLRWTVTAASTTRPSWDAAPALVSSERRHLGCGPEALVHIAVQAHAPDGDVFYRVSLKGQSRVTFCAEAREGTLAIGRWMCGGPVDLSCRWGSRDGVGVGASLTLTIG